MLNEPASVLSDRSGTPIMPEDQTDARRTEDNRLNQIREFVSLIMAVEIENVPSEEIDEERYIAVLNPESYLIASFQGRLLIDSETAYDQLDSQLKTYDLLPVFRSEEDKQIIHIISGRLKVRPRAWWPNLVLFLLTLLSVLYVGAEQAISEIMFSNPFRGSILAMGFQEAPWEHLWRGLPYAASVLLILGAHELGHYFAARRHKLAVTLPYFIPFPVGLFGTMGAAIQLREPMKNRKVLLEVGAAGPLAGLIFAIPILFIGLATSTVAPIPPVGYSEGNSIFYALAKIITFGEFLPNGREDVFVNQLAWAGWIGLFVTGLNLLPIGQLDGGHVLYSLVGNKARLLYLPVLIGLGLLVVFTNTSLMLMLFLLLFLGRSYAVPLDDITPLDSRRRLFAVFTLAVFVLVFVPVPLSQYVLEPSRNIFDTSVSLPMLSAVMIVLSSRLMGWLRK